MVLGRPQKPGGGVALLEGPAESGERTLGTIKSSLTVIENPSLDDCLGILMAGTTRLNVDANSFFNVYILWAYGNFIDPNVSHMSIAKSEQQSGIPPPHMWFHISKAEGILLQANCLMKSAR